VKPRPKGRPRALGDLVPQVLEEMGFDRANTLRQLAELWDGVLETAVGAGAVGHSRPTGLRGSVLEATADSSTWCHHLQLQHERILAGLVRELGQDAPTDLWFRVG
jgi:predicted nucleic acid-binding Zn ribbon protein